MPGEKTTIVEIEKGFGGKVGCRIVNPDGTTDYPDRSTVDKEVKDNDLGNLSNKEDEI